MPGVIYRVIPKQVFDFSGLAASSSVLILGAKGVNISAYREASVIFRMHTITWPASASVDVKARIDAPSEEDPQIDFTPTSDLVSVSFTYGSDAVPGVKLGALPANFGAWLRVLVKGNTGASTGTFQACLSVDLVAKS